MPRKSPQIRWDPAAYTAISISPAFPDDSPLISTMSIHPLMTLTQARNRTRPSVRHHLTLEVVADFSGASCCACRSLASTTTSSRRSRLSAPPWPCGPCPSSTRAAASMAGTRTHRGESSQLPLLCSSYNQRSLRALHPSVSVRRTVVAVCSCIVGTRRALGLN